MSWARPCSIRSLTRLSGMTRPFRGVATTPVGMAPPEGGRRGGRERDEEVEDLLKWDAVHVDRVLEDFMKGKSAEEPLPFPKEMNYIGNLQDEDVNDGSELGTYGHAIMDQVREVVKYQGLVEGELPLLAQFAQTYTPPTEKEILEVRTIDYPGEEHPLEYKVSLTVSPAALKLSPSELHKFLLLAGPRYDPNKQQLKISSERFQSRTMNLKWASEALDKLIAEAKDTKDTFADIPLTFPHAKVVKDLSFPKQWLMTKAEAEEMKASWKVVEEEEVVSIPAAVAEVDADVKEE